MAAAGKQWHTVWVSGTAQLSWSLGRIAVLVGVCVGLALPLVAQEKFGRSVEVSGAWPAEKVALRDGRELSGLIESEDEAWLNLIEIHRPRGRPMFLVIRPVDRASLAGVTRLGPKEREELRRRIEQFVHRTSIEAGRMEAIRLVETQKDSQRRWSYRGKWFALESTADAETTRRIILRTEQVFTGYRQVLPPRSGVEGWASPLRILVFDSLEDYHAQLQSRGLKVVNRAIYLPDQNLVLAGSELGRYAAELAGISARHRALLAELRQMEQDLPRRLSEIGRQLQEQGTSRSEIRDLLNREKRRAEEELKRKETEVRRCERENDRALDRVAGQTLTRLGHEGFHAYLENYVYPARSHEVPAWLNEGLATMFEAGLVESGIFRLDAPNRGALEDLQADLSGGRPLPLGNLLMADARAFLVGQDDAAGLSRRTYGHAWGLAYYLAFEKHILGSATLDEYVARGPQPMPPVERFEKLVGQKLDRFEPTWREYIRGLR